MYKKGEIINKSNNFIEKIHSYRLIKFSTKDLNVFLNFIENSVLNEKYIEKFKEREFDVLNQYNKLISNLHNYWDYFYEKEILKQVNELLKFIEPKYATKEFIEKYPYIIKIILELNHMKIIDINLDNIFDKMKENIKYFDDYILVSYDLPNMYKEKINEKTNILRKEINNNFELKIKNKFNYILCSTTNDEEWITDFFDISIGHIIIIGFLANVNIDKLVQKIYRSSPKQINGFLKNINNKVYYNIPQIKEFDKEKQALTDFKTALKEYKKDNIDKVVILQIENIINYIGG
ncbi:hypothetical protein [[Clostridium] colinum]|uniref:hypothetical protein n=1 Tax=[Clostridium] colinum TaxID=36835 RepID=UPI002023F3A0|nr:hypothetical protein [[Clostridium] colinum]